MEKKNKGSLMTFSCTHDYPNQPETTITVQTDAVSLDDITTTFQDFLRGCGFHFSGEVTIVTEEDTTDQKEMVEEDAEDI